MLSKKQQQERLALADRCIGELEKKILTQKIRVVDLQKNGNDTKLELHLLNVLTEDLFSLKKNLNSLVRKLKRNYRTSNDCLLEK